MSRGCTCWVLGLYDRFTHYVPSDMRPFLFGCHISLLLFCTQSGEELWFLVVFENVWNSLTYFYYCILQLIGDLAEVNQGLIMDIAHTYDM